MKFHCAVLYVLGIIASIGSASCDPVGSDATTENPEGGVPPGCDLVLEGTPSRSIPKLFLDSIVDCLHHEIVVVKRALNVSHTTEEYRDIYAGFCEKLPAMNTCTAARAADARTCLNESQTDTIRVFRDNVETVLNVGCEERGVPFAAITEEILKQGRESELKRIMNQCFIAESDITRLDGNDPSGTSVAMFRLVRSMRSCVAERGEGQIAGKILLESLLGGIMKKMRCLEPESLNQVLCESMVEN